MELGISKLVVQSSEEADERQGYEHDAANFRELITGRELRKLQRSRGKKYMKAAILFNCWILSMSVEEFRNTFYRDILKPISSSLGG